MSIDTPSLGGVLSRVIDTGFVLKIPCVFLEQHLLKSVYYAASYVLRLVPCVILK